MSQTAEIVSLPSTEQRLTDGEILQIYDRQSRMPYLAIRDFVVKAQLAQTGRQTYRTDRPPAAIAADMHCPVSDVLRVCMQAGIAFPPDVEYEQIQGMELERWRKDAAERIKYEENQQRQKIEAELRREMMAAMAEFEKKENVLLKIRGEVDTALESIRRLVKTVHADMSKDGLNDLGELKIGNRAYLCLKREGINDVFDLLKRSREDLLRLPNFGRKSLHEVCEALDAHGLHLKDDD